MRHKTCIISPKVLEKHNIPYNKLVQKAREIIIVFPYAYHSGFNHGFNIAEAINFASQRWIEYGKRHRPCDCDKSRYIPIFYPFFFIFCTYSIVFDRSKIDFQFGFGSKGNKMTS
jgi:jumonji domain-containing protein 2